MDHQHHDQMTYREILTANVSLQDLASRGCKNAAVSDKLARMTIWAEDQKKAFENARKRIQESYAMRNPEGGLCAERRRNEETQEWEDVPNTVKFENPGAFSDAVDELLDRTVNLSGTKLTATDLGKLTPMPEPIHKVRLGKLYEWPAEESEDEPEEVS